MKLKQERLGEIFILLEVLLFSIFPILINQGTQTIPPLFLAGITTIITSPIFLIQLIHTKKLKEIVHPKGLLYSIIVTICIVIIPSILIFKGTKLTTSVNTAIFLQMEIIFAIPICALLIKEKISAARFFSSIIITAGAVMVLYNDEFIPNIGDLLIITGTILYPIGNIYAKKAFEKISPNAVLFIRSLLGGAILIAISFLFEDTFGQAISITKENLILILVTGILINWLTKVLWYEGLKRLAITKATGLAMAYPAFTLILAITFVGEKVVIHQIAGLLIILSGIYLSLYKDKKLVPIQQN